MATNFNIPHQARFIPTQTIFEADFNTPVTGKYSFNVEKNQNIRVEPLNGNTVYLIDRVSVGGDIAELSFQNAIEDPPMLEFKREIQKEIVYQRKYPVLNYIDDQDFTAWIYSNKGNDWLTVSLNGLLAQTNDLIGVGKIRIYLSLSIYAIDSNVFSKYFKGAVNKVVGVIGK